MLPFSKKGWYARKQIYQVYKKKLLKKARKSITIKIKIMGALDILGGAITGGLMTQFNNANQLDLQGKMLQQQDDYNAIQGKRNIDNQMDLWHKTNYSAQVEELNKAGLNPALMYKQGGAGGTTAANTVNNTSASASRPMEIQQMIGLSLQNSLQKAQIENIEADTKGKEIDNTNKNKDGVGFNNIKADTAVKEQDAAIKKVQATIANATIEESISMITTAAQKLHNEWEIAVTNNWVSQNTATLKVKQAEAELIKTGLENLMIKSNINLNKAKIIEISEGIKQKWVSLSLDERNTIVNELNQQNNKQNADTNQGMLKLQQFIKDIPDSTKLSADVLMGLFKGILTMGIVM